MTSEKEILAMVKTLLNPPDDADEDDLGELEERFIDAIRHPGGLDLLNYPGYWGLHKDASAEEIVACALSWVPKALAMRVTAVRPHPVDKQLRCYEIVGQKIRTQVVADAGFDEGQVIVVALSGCTLKDGTLIRHSFIGRAFSAGKAVAVTNEPEGTDLTPLYCRDAYTK